MSQPLQIDAVPFQRTYGRLDFEPLPGIALVEVPGRVARGRGADRMVLAVVLTTPHGRVGGNALDSLFARAAETYYRTPGSVTSASRNMVQTVNGLLERRNADAGPDEGYTGALTAVVIRNEHLYVVQAGPGRVLLVQQGAVRLLRAGSRRPLGRGSSPQVDYHHSDATSGTMLMLGTDLPADLDDEEAQLSTGGLSTLLGAVLDRLPEDFAGLALHLVPDDAPANLRTALQAASRRDSASPHEASQPATDPAPAAAPDPPRASYPAAPPPVESYRPPPPPPPPAAPTSSRDNSLADVLARVRAATEGMPDDDSLGDDLPEELLGTPALPPERHFAAQTGPTTDAYPVEDDLPSGWLIPSSDTGDLDAMKAPLDFGPLERARQDDSEAGDEDDDDDGPPVLAVLDDDVVPVVVLDEDDDPSDSEEPADDEPADDDALAASEGDDGPDEPATDDEDDGTPEPAPTETVPAPAPEDDAPSGTTEMSAAALFGEPENDLDDEPDLGDDDEFAGGYDAVYDPPANQPQAGPIERVRRWFVGLPLMDIPDRFDALMRRTGAPDGGEDAAEDDADTEEGTHPPAPRPRQRNPVQIPTGVYVAIAVLVPIAVAMLTLMVFDQRWRSERMAEHIASAQTAVVNARQAPDDLTKRLYYEEVIRWVDTAPQRDEELDRLKDEAKAFLDTLDGILRLDLQPVTNNGFSNTAIISRVMAAGDALYALDSANQQVYRAIVTGDGLYARDFTFRCGEGTYLDRQVSQILGMAWLSSQNLTGQETLILLDISGTLLYCPPGGDVLASSVTQPGSGWTAPIGIETYADRLYVLDPAANDIWVYTQDNEIFSPLPEGYFTVNKNDGNPDNDYALTSVIDFTIVEGDIYLLHNDGRMDVCSRAFAGSEAACTQNLAFSDNRLTRTSGGIRLDDVSNAVALAYSPPPEPSLFIADATNVAAYQLSLKLLLSRQYRPASPLPGDLSDIALSPDRVLFFASGDNVYYARRP